MSLCLFCLRFQDADHECEVLKRMLENQTELSAPFLHSSAVPTRQGPDSFRVKRG